MYVLEVTGVLGIILTLYDLLYDPELLTQLSGGHMLSGRSVLFFHTAFEAVLSLAAAIGIRLIKNWGRLLGGILLLSSPLSFLLYLIADPVDEGLYILVLMFLLFAALFVALGIAVLFFERSKRFFGLLPDLEMIETPPPPPQFD